MVLQVSFYHRNVARQQQQQQQWLQKRRQENAARRLAGEEPLPEEDPALFKPIPEPSPLDVYLINNQVCHPSSGWEHVIDDVLVHAKDIRYPQG